MFKPLIKTVTFFDFTALNIAAIYYNPAWQLIKKIINFS